jgi:hypothetical protein
MGFNGRGDHLAAEPGAFAAAKSPNVKSQVGWQLVILGNRAVADIPGWAPSRVHQDAVPGQLCSETVAVLARHLSARRP